jgi:hypothetical protein
MRRLTRSVTPRAALAAAAAGALLLVARPALAADCSALGGPPIVWIENGDTQEPLLKRLGKQLIQSQQKIRIVYRNRPTCELADNFYGARNLGTVANRPLRYIPEDPTFDPVGGTTPTCDAPASPPAVMLAIGATFLSSCPTLPAKPAGVTVVDGPNQAYGFIVNKGSQEVAITAEEGYLAFGFTGGTGEAAPWLDQNLRFIRGTTASTTLTMAAAMGLKSGQLKAAAPSQTSLILLNAVAQAADAQAAIGILGTELFDQKRGDVKLLAFKAFGQRYAYFPDSTSTAFDKQNVRDGHYLPWAPTPYLFEDDGTGSPKDANARRVFELLLEKRVESDVNGLKQVIDSGLVPQCAMKVKRDFDGGDLSLFDPPDPCGCFFEANVPQGSTTCTACTDDGPCAGGKCRFGYCEAK